MTNRRPVAALLFLAIVALASCGRSDDTTAVEQEAAALPGAQSAGSIPRVLTTVAVSEHRAYPVAIAGAVQLESVSVPLEVGSPIPDGRTVAVGPQSYIDIQFGTRAVVRLAQNSRATISTAASAARRPVMQIDLLSGSVAAQVDDLVAGEVLRVLTPAASYRVLGTEFAVTTGEGDELAVREGAVAVAPRSLDLVSLADHAARIYAEAEDVGSATPPLSADESQALGGAIEQLGAQVFTVSAGQQVVLSAQSMDKGDRLAAQLAEKLALVEQASASDRPSVIAEFVRLSEEVRGTLQEGLEQTPQPSSEIEAKLAMIDEVRLLPVPKDPGNESLLDVAGGGELVKFSLRTSPQDAMIFVGGNYVGRSNYEGIFRRNESIAVRVTKNGYRERRIQIDRARSEVLTVQLERLPPSISVSSFIKAIEAGDISTVRTYINEGGSPDVRTDSGVPALVLGAGLVPALAGETEEIELHDEIVRVLLAAGADVNTAFAIEGEVFKPLHAAVLATLAGFDADRLVDQLIGAGADVNDVIAVQGEELTPLAIAIRWALFAGETQEPIIKSLVAAGADMDVTITFDDELLTLREVAAQLVDEGEVEDPELIRLLRQAGLPG